MSLCCQQTKIKNHRSAFSEIARPTIYPHEVQMKIAAQWSVKIKRVGGYTSAMSTALAAAALSARDGASAFTLRSSAGISAIAAWSSGT